MTLKASATEVDNWKWMKGNANVAGATGTGDDAVLTINSAAAGDAGNYKVVFTNAAGTVTSNVVAVTVN